MGIKIRKDDAWVNVATLSLGTGTTKVALLWDQKTAGTDGGTFTSGDWRDRTLNTKNDPQSMVALDSGNVYFSLEAGTYQITWSAPANNVHLQKTQLIYATNSSFTSPTTIQGSSGFDSSNIDPNSQTRSFGETILTITEKNYFKIQHRCTTTQDNYGFGGGTGLAAEIYTQVRIEDLETSAGSGGGGGGAVTDGDKGDITVSNSGATWMIDNDTIEEKHIDAGGSVGADKVLVYDADETTKWKWATQSGDVNVIQYSDNNTTRTNRAVSCSGSRNPIGVVAGVIGIGTTSNAYGERYVQNTEPASSCDGDVWFDTSDTTGTGTDTGMSKVAILKDQKGYNVEGGQFVKLGWRDRDLTVIEDTNSFVNFVPTPNGETTPSPGNNPGYWSLPAGTYRIVWSAPAVGSDHHQTRLIWSTTKLDISAAGMPNSLETAGKYSQGSSENGTLDDTGDHIGNRSFGSKIIEITDTTWFKLVHWCDHTYSGTTGFGQIVNSTHLNSTNFSIYTEIRIEDLAVAIKETEFSNSAITRVALLKDKKNYDVGGGTFTNGAWRDRDLTVAEDPQGFVNFTIGGSQTTYSPGNTPGYWSVPAGTYKIEWSAPGYAVDNHFSRLVWSITESEISTAGLNASDYEDGSSVRSSADNDVFTTNFSSGSKVITTTAAATYFKILHRCGDTQDTNGFGRNANLGSGMHNIYTQVRIEDLATAVKEIENTGITKVAKVEDVKELWNNIPQGGGGSNYPTTGGGLFAPAKWNPRDLNKITDPKNIGITSTSFARISVPAGTYSFNWRCPAYDVNIHSSRLAYSESSSLNGDNQLDTNVSYVYGINSWTHNDSGNTTDWSIGFAPTLTLAAKTYIQIQHFSTTGNNSVYSAMGVPNNISTPSALNEDGASVYTTLEIQDLATAVKAGVDQGDKIEEGTTSAEVINNGSGDGYFKVTTEGTERFRIDPDGRVLIGNATASTSNLLVYGDGTTDNKPATIYQNALSGTGANNGFYVGINHDNANGYVWNYENVPIIFATNNTEKLRITADGNVTTCGTESFTRANAGFTARIGDAVAVTRATGAPLEVNRHNDDGVLVYFYQNNSDEGNIAVSGSTVSYNGGHLSRWSQLVGISTNVKSDRPTIYQGTVMSNLDEMCEWPGETNQQLNKTKVSDSVGDKNIAGVFWTWDDDDDVYTNDFYVAMTGDMVIRVAASTTVARGDLLESAGDGTAKPQSDDIVRSKTIAKIISTTSTATYADGSKAYPCVLMAS